MYLNTINSGCRSSVVQFARNLHSRPPNPCSPGAHQCPSMLQIGGLLIPINAADSGLMMPFNAADQWLVDEIKLNLPRELDFLHEAQNAERCRANFSSSRSKLQDRWANLIQSGVPLFAGRPRTCMGSYLCRCVLFMRPVPLYLSACRTNGRLV